MSAGWVILPIWLLCKSCTCSFVIEQLSYFVLTHSFFSALQGGHICLWSFIPPHCSSQPRLGWEHSIPTGPSFFHLLCGPSILCCTEAVQSAFSSSSGEIALHVSVDLVCLCKRWVQCLPKELSWRTVCPSAFVQPPMCLHPYFFVSIIQSSSLQVLDQLVRPFISASRVLYMVCPMVTFLSTHMGGQVCCPKLCPLGGFPSPLPFKATFEWGYGQFLLWAQCSLALQPRDKREAKDGADSV